MTDAEKKRVVEIIAKSLKTSPEELSLDATFEDLGRGSLDALSLVGDLEEEFHVEIPNDQAMAIRGVRDTLESMEKLLEAGR